MKRKSIKIFIILLFLASIFSLNFLGINFYVINSTKDQILKYEDLNDIDDIDCILVLGAGIRNGRPSPMLEARLLEGINLYNKGISSKILMSGDHGQDNYDEVNVMKRYGIEQGINSEDIFMDHAGFSTYDSIYRAKNIFGAKKVIIVTQKYHLYRALYIANELGLEAYGINADPQKYQGQFKREIREILARNKDFIKSKLKPESTYLGEHIPVSGNGNITNDKNN